MALKECTDSEYDCEDASINSVCDSMSPADVLLSLALECPRDYRRKSCSVREIESLRKMGVKQAYSQINNLSISEQKELVDKHRKCSSHDYYKGNKILD